MSRLRTAARRTASYTVAGAGALALMAFLPAGASADNVWDLVAACESSGDWSINTGNGYYGGLQISPYSWEAYGGHRWAKNADTATKNQQIYIGQRILESQGPGAWPTCSERAGLTVENGLAVDVGTLEELDAESTNPPSDPPTNPPTGVGDIAVDGELGPQTYGKLEHWLERPVDGYLDTSDTMAFQSRLGVAADGDFGPISTTALQHLVGAYPDGEWGPLTTASLQGYLNAND